VHYREPLGGNVYQCTQSLNPIHTSADIMAPVSFWSTPGSYIHWAARAKPAIFWSIVIGSLGPVFVVRIVEEDRGGG